MNKKIVSGLVLTTLLVCMLTLVFNAKLLRASGTIYIRADGSVDPDDGRIVTEDNVHYSLTQDIYDSIIVTRGGIVVDGANHTIEGKGIDAGIKLSGIRETTIVKNMKIKVFYTGISLIDSRYCNISRIDISVSMLLGAGIYLEGSSYNSISETNITANKEYGLELVSSSSNIISNCTIDNLNNVNARGISLSEADSNIFHNNTVTNNGREGIYIVKSDSNIFYRNTVTNNRYQGIEIVSGSDDNVFSENIISNNSLEGMDLDGDRMVLHRNIITNNGGIGIKIWPCYDLNCSGNIITKNRGYGINGWDLKSWWTDEPWVITRNNVTNNEDGIYVSGEAGNVSENIVTNNGYGIFCSCHDVTSISGNIITENEYGMQIAGYRNNVYQNTIVNNGIGTKLYHFWNNTFFENTILNNMCGVNCTFSDNNCISGNSIIANNLGIYLLDSSNNSITGNNTLAYNECGVSVEGNYANDNHIYYNNFIDNEVQVVQNCLNSWDDDYPSGGNYWSDYEGIDQDGDGIGDTETPHNKDRYPFIVPLGPIPVFHKEARYDCSIEGSMTVSNFNVDNKKTIIFNINGEGYVNLTIPRTLLDGSLQVFVDNTPIPCCLSWNKESPVGPTQISIHFEHVTSFPLEVKIEALCKFQGDLNGDGKVNIIDIAMVAANFGETLD